MKIIVLHVSKGVGTHAATFERSRVKTAVVPLPHFKLPHLLIALCDELAIVILAAPSTVLIEIGAME